MGLCHLLDDDEYDATTLLFTVLYFSPAPAILVQQYATTSLFSQPATKSAIFDHDYSLSKKAQEILAGLIIV